MGRIARDETRHAALAWRVARWADRRLDASSRRAVERARRAALATLRHELSSEPPVQLVRILGLPRAGQALHLLDAIQGTLFASAATTVPAAQA
jgi:hypothetical protein